MTTAILPWIGAACCLGLAAMCVFLSWCMVRRRTISVIERVAFCVCAFTIAGGYLGLAFWMVHG